MPQPSPIPTPSAPELSSRGPRCRIVASPAESALHHRIRHEVFVIEQAVFIGDDTDELDDAASTLKVVAYRREGPAGAVRLYPTAADGSIWQGDRLAVRAAYRRLAVGAPLVDCAVATAADRGGEVMTAHVQVPNVRFFEGLGWRRAGDTEIYVGLPHQPMAIDLRSW